MGQSTAFSTAASESAYWQDYKALVRSDRDRFGRASNPRAGIQIPLPGSREFEQVHGRGGDVLVVQVASRIGCTRSQKNSLRSLGLRRINSCSLGLHSDQGFMGMVKQVRHLVRVIKFIEPQYKTQLEFREFAEGSLVKVERMQYGTATSPSELWRVDNEEYVYSEVNNSQTVVAWSTTQHVGEFAFHVREILGPPSDSDVGELSIRSSDGQLDIGDGSTEDALQYIEESPRAVEFALLEIGGLTIRWKFPFRRFNNSRLSMSEASIQSDHLTDDVVTAIVARTGSVGLGSILPISVPAKNT